MINQARFANNVRFFRQGFLNRWDLDEYYDTSAPCFFAGAYNAVDVSVINAHRGFKVVWNPGRMRSVFNRLDPENLVVMIGNGIECNVSSVYSTKHVNIEIKDFSQFEPNPLGSSVYWYLGNNKSKEMYGYREMKIVRDRIPFDIIEGIQGKSMDYVKENFYDNCFVNVKPIMHGGLTSATELAFMGRKTISNTKAPFCVGYEDTTHMIDLILSESEKVGTTQPDIASKHFESTHDWRHKDFWI